MNKRDLLARATVGALGGCLLVGAAGAAIANPLEDDDVDVNVTIDPLPSVGALTMTVAADATNLTEVASSDPALRQFDGTLPTVTVTDDRDEAPADHYWYVTGQSSAFISPDLPDISAEQLGWRPHLLAESNGWVMEGDEVVTVHDPPSQPGNNTGLVSEDLLVLALDSGEARPTGSWDVTADLFLKTPADVMEGSYSAVVTLTLWEDEY